jgi:tRNA dimethylallyltransferase
MNKVCVITGLTATGKSRLAVEIAQACNAIILSVDSVAVYKELPIASAAPTIDEQGNIPHYGIGIVSVAEGMDVARFQTYALDVIKKAFQNNQNVVLVGGSGLYLNAVLYDYEFKESTQKPHVYDDMDNESLYALMCEKDPSLKDQIHVNNRQRLIRALVLMDELNMSKAEHLSSQKKELRFPVKIVACDFKDRKLHRLKMSERVDQMMALGLMDEIRSASKQVDFSHSAMSAIGVRQWKDVFDSKLSVEECVAQIKTKTHQFAKRQRTWFKHQLPCEWLYIDEPNAVNKKKEECIAWMSNSHE